MPDIASRSPRSAARSLLATAVAVALTLISTAPAQAESRRPAPVTAAVAATDLDAVTVVGTKSARSAATTTRLPLSARETPQSISHVDIERIEDEAMLSVDDTLKGVTGINATFYDTQRPLYFARGFQVQDFQVDGIPTYSGSTNLEYDMALYERVEVIRGANGLISGAGKPSATVNLLRKRPGYDFAAGAALTVGEWGLRRGQADVSVPLAADGQLRSRFVLAKQDREGYLDRYREEKSAGLATLEFDLGDATTLALGYQFQDNQPTASNWGTIPRYAADGQPADFARATNFAPDWTRWARDSNTAYASLEHRFGNDWQFRAAWNRTRGHVFSLRAYASGFPDPLDGSGVFLRGAVGETDDVRDSFDVYFSGSFELLGREHDLAIGGNYSRLDAHSPGYASLSGWRHDIPDAYRFDGRAPMPLITRTGAFRDSRTQQSGLYATARLRVADPVSLVLGARLSDWETGTDNHDTQGTYINTTGAYKVDDELTPYAGIVFDITPSLTAYASYTGIFQPQNYRDKHNALLAPVEGSNLEAGLKGRISETLDFSTAVFDVKQDNFAIRDHTQPDASLPDGSSAYVGVDGTRSRGLEFDVNGSIGQRWRINAGYTYLDTERHDSDRIWVNLPEHTLKLSTHYRFGGKLDGLSLGGGLRWQNEMTAFNVEHPTLDTVDVVQGSYALADLFANYAFSPNLSLNLSARNLFDRTYWATLDYPNYGEPRQLTATLRWRY